jgi:hypothetical protein
MMSAGATLICALPIARRWAIARGWAIATLGDAASRRHPPHPHAATRKRIHAAAARREHEGNADHRNLPPQQMLIITM